MLSESKKQDDIRNNAGAPESISCFEVICDKCVEKLESGRTGEILNAYSREKAAFERSAIATVVRNADCGNGLIRRIKRSVARVFEESLFMSLCGRARAAALGCHMKTYGVFFTTFGIYTSLIFLIKKYALYTGGTSWTDLFIGIVMMVLSLPLLFSSKTLAESLGTSVLLHSVLSDACGITPDKLASEKSGVSAVQSWAVIAGIAAGMLTYFVSPARFLTALFGVVFAAVLLCFPEAGVSVSLVLAPFMRVFKRPSMMLASIILLAALGFAVKYFRGKRTVVCGPAEAAVAAFMLLTLCGGIFVSGSSDPKPAVLRAVLMLVYFLIVNTVNDRRRLSACVDLLLISATIVAFAGVCEYLLGRSAYNWLDVNLFSAITGRSTSVFLNPNSLAYYVASVFPFALAGVVLGRSRRERFLAGFSAVTMLFCAVFTWSRGAWIGMACSAMIFLLIITPRAVTVVPVAVAGGSALCMVFPQTFGARIDNMFSLADSANYYRVRVWNGASRMIGKYFAGGIGIGEKLFGSVYMRFADPEVWRASHAHSLWLGTLVELGIPGLIMLLLTLFLLVQKCAGCIRQGGDKKLLLTCGAGICGVTAMIFSGFFDFVWYNYTVFFIFWTVAGVTSAAAEIRTREISAFSAESISAVGDERSADIMIALG